MDWSSIDFSGIVGIVSSIVVALLGWALTAIRKRQEAETNQTKAQTALLKLSAIAVAMAGRAWDTLSPRVQVMFADGNFSPAERKEFETLVQSLIKDFCSEDDLEEIAKALSLPLPGVIAKIAAFIIDRVTAAHDPDLPETQSPSMFPVQPVQDFTSGG